MRVKWTRYLPCNQSQPCNSTKCMTCKSFASQYLTICNVATYQVRSPLLLVALSSYIVIPNYMLKFEKAELVDTERVRRHAGVPQLTWRRNLEKCYSGVGSEREPYSCIVPTIHERSDGSNHTASPPPTKRRNCPPRNAKALISTRADDRGQSFRLLNGHSSEYIPRVRCTTFPLSAVS